MNSLCKGGRNHFDNSVEALDGDGHLYKNICTCDVDELPTIDYTLLL